MDIDFEVSSVECVFDRLYKERLAQIDSKLEEVRGGRAAEYLEPLQQLQEQMQIRTQVAGIVMCLIFGTPKIINFPFGTNEKLTTLGVPILEHITVV